MVKKIIRIAFALSIIISFLFFLQSTDINESLHQARKLNYNILLILLSTLLAYTLGALGWRSCIDSENIPSFRKLFILRHICNVITNFNPSGAVAGELFNANMLISYGISKDIAYKSVLLSRTMMVLSQLLILLTVICCFLARHSPEISKPVRTGLYASIFAFLVIIISLSFIILKKGKRESNVSEHHRPWRQKLQQISVVRSSLASYIKNHPAKAISAFGFFGLHWIVGSLELYFIINAFGYKIDVWESLFLDTLIIVSKSAVTFIPGQVGAEELINKCALYLIKLNSASLWLSVSLLRRARQLFWGSIAILFYLGIKYSKRQINSINKHLEKDKSGSTFYKP